ncbi:MAG: hypothetical protein HFE25_02500 [Clostridia bacterium]|jgi:hypothetical protein|nr:hypothetical protein [Clostridia bacterium]
MKKKGIFLTVILLAVAMLTLLCGCSAYGKIQSAYEKAGYEEQESVPNAQKDALKAIMGEDYENVCTVHVMTRTPEGLADIGKTNVVIILEFKSNDAIKEEIDKREGLKNLLKDSAEDLQQSKIVSGNCVLIINVGFDMANAYSIFESTK